MIVVDCEKMRWNNCGIYTFCDELSAALLRQQSQHQYKLGFYLRKKCRNVLGDVPRIFKRELHKVVFYDPRIQLWHSTFQLKAIIPLGVPVVQTIHDLNYLYEDIDLRTKVKIHRNIARYIRRASHIVTISEYVMNDLCAHFDLGDKPRSVIYNGYDTYNGPVEKPAYVPTHPYLFFIGGMLWKKNIHVLPCLLSGNNYELVIAGSQDKPEHTKCIDAIMKEAAEWGVQDRVHIVGPVSEAVKYWYFRHCEAFVFPSLAEGFGLPAIEAMQQGKPVFLSDHTSLPEIGDEYGYYFNHDFDRQGMIAEFKESMEHYHRHPDLPEQIKKHAMKFSWDEAARRYWDIYESLLNKHKK